MRERSIWSSKTLAQVSMLDSLPAGTSTGLSGMRERALLLGGNFHIESGLEKGTSLKAQIPLTKGNILNAQGMQNLGKNSRRYNKFEEVLTWQPELKSSGMRADRIK